MSTMKLDRWTSTSNGSAVQTLVQLNTYSTTLISSYEGLSAYNLNEDGTTPSYDIPPVYNRGIHLTSFTFTPKYTNSRIFLETSLITAHETSNVSDDIRFFVVDGAGQLISWTRGSPSYYFNAGWNSSVFSLIGEFASWGTEAKTLKLKADTSGGSPSYFFNGRYNSGYVVPPFYVTIMEYI